MISACDSVWGACVLAINSYVMQSTATSTRITVQRERRSSGAYPQIRWEAPLLLLLLLLLPLTYSKQTTWFPLRKQKKRERGGGRERDRGWAREKESEREDWSWFRGGVITSAAAGGPQWGRENHFCRLDLPVFFLPILHHRAITKPTQYHPPPPQRSTEALEQLHSTAGATEVQGSNLFSWIYDTCRKLICVHTLKYRCSR